MSRLFSRLAGFFFACVSATAVHAVPNVINEEAKFSDGGVGGELSGSTVSISGDTAVMGAPAESSGRGAAYVFVRDALGWSLQQKLEASDGLSGDSFGTSVSVSGDRVAIGAPGRSSGRGAVYTFSRAAGVWTQQPTPLTASDASVGDQLGFSVSLQGLTLVAGAPFDDVNSKTDTGSAYVFTNNGTTWSQFFHIQITTGQVKPQDHLGWSVALSGNTVLVGAPDDDFGNKTDAGSVYVFVRNGNRFSRQARLNPGGAAGDRWGASVALFSNTALVGADGADGTAGANQGAAVVYTRAGTTWTASPRLTASDAAAGDRFGASVGLSGPLAVVGAPFADGAGADSGKAYVFGDSGAGYVQIDTLVASDNAAGDGFGASAGVDAGRAIVGAPRADNPGVDSGAAYVFLLVQPTTTTITSVTPEPSVTGQSYTVSVTVTAPAGTPPGTVDISDGDAGACTITLVNGSGSCSLTSIAAFLHTITASYAGTIVFGASLDTETHLVNKADTTVAITSDAPDPSLVGETVTVAAAVSVSAPGAGAPTGLIAITGTATSGCVIDLSVGTTCTLTFTATGMQSLVATYSGDDDFNASDNTTAPESHQVAQSQTTTALVSAANPSVTGESVTLTATLSVTAPGAGPPAGGSFSGTMSFYNGAALIGTASVNASGVATLNTAFNAVGTYALHAEFGGDSNYASSTSPDQNHVVNVAATTTTLGSAPNPSGVGQSVVLTASVAASAPGGGIPTGSVEFFNGATSLGTGTLDASGVATLTTSFANAGTYQLHAVYAGDLNYTGSTSTDLAHVVNAAGTTTTITSDLPDPSTAGNGYTVNVTVTSAFGATPTGSVTIDDANGGTCTITALTAGAGSCTLTSTMVGTLTLTATYTPDVADFAGSSGTDSHTVNSAADAIFKDSFE